MSPSNVALYQTFGVRLVPNLRNSKDHCFVFFTPSPKVPVQSWFDDMNDTELLDLLPFFEGLSKEEEVYGVLQNLRSR